MIEPAAAGAAARGTLALALGVDVGVEGRGGGAERWLRPMSSTIQVAYDWRIAPAANSSWKWTPASIGLGRPAGASHTTRPGISNRLSSTMKCSVTRVPLASGQR